MNGSYRRTVGRWTSGLMLGMAWTGWLGMAGASVNAAWVSVAARASLAAGVFLVPWLSRAAPVSAAEHAIRPGESPQRALDRAAPGDRLVFLPGVHEHGLGKHRAMLYVDKSVEIELQAGAVLRLAPDSCRREARGEITTDQDGGKKLDDLEVGGQFDVTRPAVDGPEAYGAVIYTIVVDGEGNGDKPDTFAWGDGRIFDTPNKQVPITGDWQELSYGVKVRFGRRTGHSRGSLWFVSYDGPEAYGIRIGHGTQSDYIENVRVFGQGTIDLNSSRNAQPSGLVKDINACVLVHGRVRGVVVEGITMTNTNRSVMCYGEHTGAMLPGGKTGPGESYDAENIVVRRTRTINPLGAAYLFGHPSHRGRMRNVECLDNYMETGKTAIEPNFNLDGYKVIGNVIKSDGQAIHCWRHSTNGVVADNLRIHDNTGKPVVVVNSPRGWQPPAPPELRNNRNHLSDPPPAGR